MTRLQFRRQPSMLDKTSLSVADISIASRVTLVFMKLNAHCTARYLDSQSQGKSAPSKRMLPLDSQA